MKNLHTMLRKYCITIFLLTATSVYAQAMQQQNDAPQTSDPQKTIAIPEMEEIQVEGKKTRLYYLNQMEKAELDFYDAFNALNDVESYRIICRLEKRTGSNMKYRVCYPQYVLQRWANETQDAMGGRNLGQLARSAVRLPTLADIEFLVKRDKEKSLKHTEKLINEHPELLKKLISLEEKRLAYEKARMVL